MGGANNLLSLSDGRRLRWQGSKQSERGPDNHARVTGNLTLHGVTAPLVLDVQLNALKRHPLTFHRTAGFSAKGTLSRRAFGMDRWEHLIGDPVTLVIEAEALLDGKDSQDDGSQH